MRSVLLVMIVVVAGCDGRNTPPQPPWPVVPASERAWIDECTKHRYLYECLWDSHTTRAWYDACDEHRSHCLQTAAQAYLVQGDQLRRKAAQERERVRAAEPVAYDPVHYRASEPGCPVERDGTSWWPPNDTDWLREPCDCWRARTELNSRPGWMSQRRCESGEGGEPLASLVVCE